jgi:ribonuclease HI
MSSIEIHCDGSCVKTIGGIGIVIVTPTTEILISKGAFHETTNNRMELLSFIYSVYYIQPYVDIHDHIMIYTDSQYVVNGYNIWMENWSKNSWKNTTNQEVNNLDLWLEMYTIKKIFQYTVIWEKGHDNNIFNNKADCLAKMGVNNNNFILSYKKE